MNRFFLFALFVGIALFSFFSCKTKDEKNIVKTEETIVLIETDYGNIKIKLYNETPIHRDNFINLVKAGVYNGTIFHRVINSFMIQGGDPSTNPSFVSEKMDSSLLDYTLKAEFNPKLFHKKGALAAARMGDNVNPEKNSSGTQFYIVQGKIFSEAELETLSKRKNDNLRNITLNELIMKRADDLMEMGIEPDFSLLPQELQDTLELVLKGKPSYNFTSDQVELYTTIGGTPHLDGDYTVFGEVIEGLETVDKIAAVKTGKFDKPIEDVIMKVSLVLK